MAVLKVDLQDLPAITFGQSKQVKVGDVVLAVGNPFGVGQSVTMGIVGALSRSQVGINTFEDFIQTDAAINPGNSGGALTDTSGNLIGINTAIYSRTGGSLGIGFAIPIHAAKQIMEQIIQSGGVIRGWLGVSMQDITEELAESFNLDNSTGTLVASVLRDGPADKAGIARDILVAVEGKPVKNSAEMLNLVAALSPGDTATITVIRNKQEKSIQIKSGKCPCKKKKSKKLQFASMALNARNITKIIFMKNLLPATGFVSVRPIGLAPTFCISVKCACLICHR